MLCHEGLMVGVYGIVIGSGFGLGLDNKALYLLPDLAGCMRHYFRSQSQGTDSVIPDFQPSAAFSGPERRFL